MRRSFRFPLAYRVPVELLADPIFMAVAVIGVCLLGISKGGFLGLGVMALPLMSLFVPPLQAAAIILPTAVAQDVLTLWAYWRNWSAWNLKIMLPSVLFVLRHWLSGRFERFVPKPGIATGVVFGVIGGVTTMLANAGGPAWQIH